MRVCRAGNQTKEVHLNMDCLVQIVNELDFESLLYMAKTSKFFSNLCVEVFRRQFSDTTILIDHYSPLSLRKYVEMSVKKAQKVLSRIMSFEFEDDFFYDFQNNDYIKISSFEMILDTLRYFGNYIQRLKIATDNADSVQSKVIGEFVNKYCSDALIEFGLRIDTGNSQDFLRKTFKNIQKVALRNRLPVVAENGLSMNETFPAMRELSLSFSSGNVDYVENRLQNLSHLRIDIGRLSNNRFIDNILGSNPSIRSVSLSNAWPAFLRKVNNMLPHLENLSIGLFEMYNGDDEIVFENVKVFRVKSALGTSLNIFFPKLQDLTMCLIEPRIDEGLGVGVDGWVDFMENNNHLRQFRLEYSFVNEQSKYFELLTQVLLNLEEMSVSSWHGQFISVDVIINFMESHQHLRKFLLEDCNEIDKGILRERFENGWNISDYLSGLVFERI